MNPQEHPVEPTGSTRSTKPVYGRMIDHPQEQWRQQMLQDITHTLRVGMSAGYGQGVSDIWKQLRRITIVCLMSNALITIALLTLPGVRDQSWAGGFASALVAGSVSLAVVALQIRLYVQSSTQITGHLVHREFKELSAAAQKTIGSQHETQTVRPVTGAP